MGCLADPWCVKHTSSSRQVAGYTGTLLVSASTDGYPYHRLCRFYTGMTPPWDHVMAEGPGFRRDYTNVVVQCGYRDRGFAMMCNPDGDVVAKEDEEVSSCRDGSDLRAP